MGEVPRDATTQHSVAVPEFNKWLASTPAFLTSSI